MRDFKLIRQNSYISLFPPTAPLSVSPFLASTCSVCPLLFLLSPLDRSPVILLVRWFFNPSLLISLGDALVPSKVCVFFRTSISSSFLSAFRLRIDQSVRFFVCLSFLLCIYPHISTYLFLICPSLLDSIYL